MSGSSHGSGARASASAFARAGNAKGPSSSGLDPHRRTRNENSSTSSESFALLSQESNVSNNSNNPNPDPLIVVDPAPGPAPSAAGAGVMPPQPPAEDEAETLRLVVSGHLDVPAETNVGKTESEERLIPWIGSKVQATQRGTEGTQVGLRDIKWTNGRIVIHPNNVEGGERLADIIRTQMRSDHHPGGFVCEWNHNLPLCAELTIRASAMGKRTEREVRDLIEAEDGGLVNLNIALCGWPQHLSGGARYDHFWDEPNNGQRIIQFTAVKGVVEAIMANPHPGKAYLGYLMGTVRHERLDVVPGTQITYRRQFAH